MPKKKQELSVFMLLDRSGSMASKWEEALGAINAYVSGLKGANVTLVAFDSSDKTNYDVLRDKVPAKKWVPVSNDDATPRGMTPLYDCVSRIVADAEAVGSEKTVILTMTDGIENTSRESDIKAVKAAVERVKSRGWEFLFLGANFDVTTQAGAINIGSGKMASYSSGTMVRSMQNLAAQTTFYDMGTLSASGINLSAASTLKTEDVQ